MPEMGAHTPSFCLRCQAILAHSPSFAIASIVHGPHQTNTVTKGDHVTKVKKHIATTSETAHIHDTAKTNIELTAQTKHIHLTAATDITLQVGASKIEMKADGTITIQGVHVDIIGSKKIDLNS